MKLNTYSFYTLFTILCLSGTTSLLAEEAQTTGTPVSESQAEARAILMDMAQFLSQTQLFKVTIHSRYDAVQENGQQIEFGEVRNIIVKRPDQFRVEVEQSDGDRNLVIYDGNTITVNTPAQNIYAQVEKTGGIDAAITYFVKDLGMHLPLAVLFLESIVTEFENRLQAIDYVEETKILGAPAHHLAGQTETVDFQVWVADGDKPLPLRVVLTYKYADGQPQYRAQFMDWDLAPKINNAEFAFTPPQGVQKISFISQLQNIATPQQDTATEQTGE